MKTKSGILVCLLLLAVYVVIGFFTAKIISSQTQESERVQRQNAEREIRQLSKFISDEIEQTGAQLSAVTQFLNVDTVDDIQQLIDANPMIKNIFILDHHRLHYPIIKDNKSDNVGVGHQEQRLLTLIQPFIDDPSSLLQYATNNESGHAISGWYNALLEHQPALIYWYKKDTYVVGYVLSYTRFRAKLIANADNVGVAGYYQLFDNGKLLLSNQRQNSHDSYDVGRSNASLSLAYPLQQWFLAYQALPVFLSPVPIFFSAVALAGVITLIIIAIYYHTQRRIRLATQQVQFVGQVSHELKTPLTNIRLYAELLDETEVLDEKERRYLQVITDESHRLTRLIQNVLNFSKASYPNVEEISVSDLMVKLSEMFTPTFSHKKLIIRCENNCDKNQMIISDKDMLVQILGNFLNNAEKYANNGSYVDIEANITKFFCKLSVRDYGKGMSKGEMKQIFKPFYRIHNHVTEGVSGTGIGLTIAKQLADSLGAQITVEQANPGLRFNINLPLSK